MRNNVIKDWIPARLGRIRSFARMTWIGNMLKSAADLGMPLRKDSMLPISAKGLNSMAMKYALESRRLKTRRGELKIRRGGPKVAMRLRTAYT